ncbi:MAG: succinate dehydrogenase, cytochrome b556 subunit [Novosphingopyxis baekryungensis]|jgi:succinate dehydrogenase / fumarate reductase cytochrome b subunit|nr:succinate dehydrogenase, cytochrome b556 subunit [Novosphingopyxis baekryungensis]
MAGANRPLSPHLQIWKWGPAMAASIAHRATGTILALVGIPVLVWWLLAAAAGAESYGTFRTWVIDAGEAGGLAVLTTILFKLAAIVVAWSFFQHMLSGLRHLVLDMGAGYELKANRTVALLTFVGSIILTLLLVAFVAMRGLGS